ncbi:ATP-dependent DNA ligase [Ascodesmis nigricans]|uniref:DNA ligase n=1 Tax=Ascodesmis nigricans TaxID=341454 RepID=A0A4S2N825_9PEZI|nr:ATP-dependent DNA ligase [Ascodesmis nigricans]
MEDEEPVTKKGRKSKKETAVETETTSPKRERGRSKKEVTGVSDEEPPKRGRPKKTVEKEIGESDEEPPKRGRGRPKKTDVEEEPEVAVESPKRGRGRPKKTAVEKEEAEEVSEEEPPKRGRGRPKKTMIEKEEADEVDEEPPKRGRSKKADVEKQATTSDVPETKTPKERSKSASPAVESDVESTPSDKEILDADDPRKPSISVKARKEVQIKLTKEKATHPYPDWPAGDPVPYAALVKTFTLIENTTKRLEKLSHTSLFLRQVLRLSPDEILPVVQLIINRLAADYEGIELGIGESLLMKAISESCGRSLQQLKADHKETGDLGEVAMKSRSTQKTIFQPKPLTIKVVHAGLKDIATTKGEGGQGRKVAGIRKLLSAAKGDEAKYLVRGLEGKLRLGLQERTLIVSLSQAAIVHEREQAGKKPPTLEEMTAAEEILKTVYSELPNYEIIIKEMMKSGVMSLQETCKLQPGVPLKPMLAKPTKSISEVIDRFENQQFTCEYKYDGERVQLHYVAPNAKTSFAAVENEQAGIAKIFSRNSEELSPKYPDIIASFPKWVAPGTESFVLDAEAVAWDREQERVLPFQMLMTRKRKDVKEEDVKVRVCVFAFDLLFLNGESLVQKPLVERRELLRKSFTPTPHSFSFATSTDTTSLTTLTTFLDASLSASCEGLMVKTLTGSHSLYTPSKRSTNWLKIKKDYLLTSTGDSLDLVVLGAYYGKGKRTSVYGAFLLACYNPDTQTFESICNIGTGFSEAQLQSLYNQLHPLEIERPKPYYSHAQGNQEQPDVWFDAKVVWEVKTADLSLSPKYVAARGVVRDREGKGRGVSLRFPRFLRDREDKSPEDATTSMQVGEMYEKQEVVKGGEKKAKGGVDEDWEY